MKQNFFIELDQYQWIENRSDLEALQKRVEESKHFEAQVKKK
jgi:hypothetical protein